MSKYGLLLPKKTGKVDIKKHSIFESDDSDDNSKRCKDIQQKNTHNSKGKGKNVSIKTEVLDPTIYQYDDIYDDMKATEAKKDVKPKGKGPLYIGHLLKAAEKRKKDSERRVEKKIQSERIKEGDVFADKESFVTSAYQRKMNEMEVEEEQERREGQLEDMMDITKQQDLSGFYRHFLKQTVGESKVPNFGERYSKKDESGKDSLVLPGSDREKISCEKHQKLKYEHCGSTSGEKPSKPNENRKSGQNVHKSQNIDSDEKCSSSSNSDDEDETVNDNKASLVLPGSDREKISSAKSRKRKYEHSASTGGEKPPKLNDNRKSGQNLRKSQNIDSDEKCSSSSDSDDEDESLNDNKEQKMSDNDGTDISATSKEVKVKNITAKFEKRTVDTIFDEAQSRYWKRIDASKLK